MDPVRQFAEKILLTDSLEEKITRPAPDLSIGPPSRGSYRAPERPGRPAALLPRPNPGKSAFPSAEQLEQEEHRARLLHFFCNHELIAVELMALALLKFPDAPDAFRRGVLHTLKEEQDHTRWYLDRMAQCGLSFGDLPVSPMIWEHISEMESPLDYVSRLSLTFEQANLDYARHYSGVLEKVGDSETAKILSQIYKDEIAHVGHGLKWLRRWKQEGESDWDAWHKRLHLPLSPVRAKGLVPFNEEGRRLAGLDDHFIGNVRHFRSSRGRSPDLYWFNPDAEAAAADPAYQPPARLEALAADLEPAFALAACGADDLFLLRREISRSHRHYLAGKGLIFPETARLQEKASLLRERTIRHQAPWATPGPHLSRQLTVDLRAELPDHLVPLPCTLQDYSAFVARHPQLTRWLAKPLYSAAGRGQLRGEAPGILSKLSGNELLEPEVTILHEVSFLFHRRPADQGGLRFLGCVNQHTSARGQWLSSTALRKSASGLPPQLARHLAQVAPQELKTYLQPALEKVLAASSYEGPVCLDSFYFEGPDGPVWQPVSEVNARWTMGRLARELRRRLAPRGNLTLGASPPAELTDDLIPLAEVSQCVGRVPWLRLW